MRHFIAPLVAGCLAVAACGTGGGDQQTSGPRHGDTLRVAIGIDPDTLCRRRSQPSLTRTRRSVGRPGVGGAVGWSFSGVLAAKRGQPSVMQDASSTH